MTVIVVLFNTAAYYINKQLTSLCEQEIKKEVMAEVKEATEFALAGSELPPHELYTDVYTDQATEGLYIRGCDVLTGNRDTQ